MKNYGEKVFNRVNNHPPAIAIRWSLVTGYPGMTARMGSLVFFLGTLRRPDGFLSRYE